MSDINDGAETRVYLNVGALARRTRRLPPIRATAS